MFGNNFQKDEIKLMIGGEMIEEKVKKWWKFR